jgi:hypothetical protein
MRLHLEKIETMWLIACAVLYFGIRIGQSLPVSP